MKTYPKFMFLACIYVIVILLMTNFSYANSNDEMNPINKSMSTDITILSDLHYYSPDLGISGANFEEDVAKDRKMIKESDSITNALVDSIINNNSTIVLISGDLTRNGEKYNHLKVESFLTKIENSGKKVYVINGNHDINNPQAYKYVSDNRESTDNITPDLFREIYANFGYNEAIAKDSNSLSYVVQPEKNLRIIAMDSCIYDDNNNLEESVIGGEFKPNTLAWIKNQVIAANEKGIKIIGVMHHSMVEHFVNEKTFFNNYVINDGDTIANELADLGLNIVFTGHFHSFDITKIKTANNNTLHDIGTGSPLTYPSSFRNVKLNSNCHKIELNTIKIDNINYNLNNLNFNDYSKNDLYLKLKGKIPDFINKKLLDNGFSEEDAALIVNEANTSELFNSKTIIDYIVETFIENYKGDEIMSQEIKLATNKLLISDRQSSKYFGSLISTMLTDSTPDNNVILDY